MTLRIATWNVNSIRTRLPMVTAWLQKTKPDVLLLQEIKCTADDFPRLEIEALGYHIAILGQKAYHGVAILAKEPPQHIQEGLPEVIPSDTPQARYIEATIHGLRIASVYVPNGNPLGTEKYAYKLKWLDAFRQHVKNLLDQETPFVFGGDYNVMPTALDVYNPAGWEADALYALPSRQAYRAIMNLGVTDAFRALHPYEQAYTFWDYQSAAWPQDHGLRIDHILLSPQTADRLVSCIIDKEPRGWEKASDHTPVIVEIRKA